MNVEEQKEFNQFKVVGKSQLKTKVVIDVAQLPNGYKTILLEYIHFLDSKGLCLDIKYK